MAVLERTIYWVLVTIITMHFLICEGLTCPRSLGYNWSSSTLSTRVFPNLAQSYNVLIFSKTPINNCFLKLQRVVYYTQPRSSCKMAFTLWKVRKVLSAQEIKFELVDRTAEFTSTKAQNVAVPLATIWLSSQQPLILPGNQTLFIGIVFSRSNISSCKVAFAFATSTSRSAAVGNSQNILQQGATLSTSSIVSRPLLTFMFEDIDECSLDQHDCSMASSYCVNTYGSYQCKCLDGYHYANQSVSRSGCVADDDLCQAETHSCSVGQTCRRLNTTQACCTGECKQNTCSANPIGRLHLKTASTSKKKLFSKSPREYAAVDSGMQSKGCYGRLSLVEIRYSAQRTCKIIITAWKQMSLNKFKMIGKTKRFTLKGTSVPQTGRITISPPTGMNGYDQIFLSPTENLYLGFSVDNSKKDGYCYIYVDSSSMMNNTLYIQTGSLSQSVGASITFKTQMREAPLVSYQFEDFDECSEAIHNCSRDQLCINTHLSYLCTCRPGYHHNNSLPWSSCVDIDECSLPQRACSTDSICNNTIGNYTCRPKLTIATTQTPTPTQTTTQTQTQTIQTTTPIATQQPVSTLTISSAGSSTTTATADAQTRHTVPSQAPSQQMSTEYSPNPRSQATVPWHSVHGSVLVATTSSNISNSSTGAAGQSSSSSPSGTLLGAIAGGVAAITILILVTVVVYCLRRHKSKTLTLQTSKEKLCSSEILEQPMRLTAQGSAVDTFGPKYTTEPRHAESSASRDGYAEIKSAGLLEEDYEAYANGELLSDGYRDAKMPNDDEVVAQGVYTPAKMPSDEYDVADGATVEAGYTDAKMPGSEYDNADWTDAGLENGTDAQLVENQYEIEKPRISRPPGNYASLATATLEPGHLYQTPSDTNIAAMTDDSYLTISNPPSPAVVHSPSPSALHPPNATALQPPSPRHLRPPSPGQRQSHTQQSRTLTPQCNTPNESLTHMTNMLTSLEHGNYQQIPRRDVMLGAKLGSGKFGKVVRGVWKTSGRQIPVAVKVLGKMSSTDMRISLLSEAAIMGQFNHGNIVNLYGVVSTGDPVCIVLELMENGDLLNYLKSFLPENGGTIPNDLPPLLLRMCQDVACGMEYLSKKEFVHRDLAARNILLNSLLKCKISHFGSSSSLDEDDYYSSKEGKIPVRWAAPEALLFHQYSTASDVWSFGILVYEVFALGRKPYGGLSPLEVLRLVAEEKYRLPPPPGCSRGTYQLMIDCWNPDKSKRPDFTSIIHRLASIDPVPVASGTGTIIPEAMLGTPLACTEQTHKDLQMLYK